MTAKRKCKPSATQALLFPNRKAGGRRYPITKREDKRVGSEEPIGRTCTACPTLGSKWQEIYSRGRRNSSRKTVRSPRACWRRTLAVIGGVSLGTMLDDVGAGAGMVR